MKILKYYYLILMSIITSCAAQIKSNDSINRKVNTHFNKDYFASKKTFYGKLNEVECKEIRKTIIAELKTIIPDQNSILINYYQHGNNCYKYGLNEKYAKEEINNGIRISARISKTYNVTDFFIYSSDYRDKLILENSRVYTLDSGFFSTNIFTLKENCAAFFIIKPNGEFMKYYGTDYYSEVIKFLEKK